MTPKRTHDVGRLIRRISMLAIFAVAIFCAIGASGATTVDYNIPTGTNGLIMVDKVGGFVRFFDAVTLQEFADSAFDPSPDPGIKPHEIAISPDHKFAYISV